MSSTDVYYYSTDNILGIWQAAIQNVSHNISDSSRRLDTGTQNFPQGLINPGFRG